MKTTIDLPDDLLERCKAVARRENSTLKALVEEGLRLAPRSRARRRAAPFTVQPFEGDGLTPEFAAAGWERVCDEIYVIAVDTIVLACAHRADFPFHSLPR